MTEPTKVCSRCKKRKPWSHFHSRRATETLPSSRCKSCDVEYRQELRDRYPDRERKYRRKHYEIMRKDPERWAIRLEQGRKSKRKIRGTPPENYRVSRRAREVEVGPSRRVDARPFRDWLRTMDGSSEEIGKRLKIDPAIVRRLLKGSSRYVSIDTIDCACQAAGESWLIHEMYPLEEAA